jgi:hypothetical protein
MIAVLRQFEARSPVPLATLDDPTHRAQIITRPVDDEDRPDSPATPRRAPDTRDAVREDLKSLAARWDLLASIDTRTLNLGLSANCIRWMLRGPSEISPATLESLRRQTAQTENAVARWAVQDAEDDEHDQRDDVDEADDEHDGDEDERERADVEADELVIETAGRALQRLAAQDPAAANRIAVTIFGERRLS